MDADAFSAGDKKVAAGYREQDRAAPSRRDRLACRCPRVQRDEDRRRVLQEQGGGNVGQADGQIIGKLGARHCQPECDQPSNQISGYAYRMPPERQNDQQREKRSRQADLQQGPRFDLPVEQGLRDNPRDTPEGRRAHHCRVTAQPRV